MSSYFLTLNGDADDAFYNFFYRSASPSYNVGDEEVYDIFDDYALREGYEHYKNSDEDDSLHHVYAQQAHMRCVYDEQNSPA